MLKPFFNIFHKQGSELMPNFYAMACDNKFLVKYMVAGSLAAFTDIFLLFTLTEYVFPEGYYLESAAIAFTAAFLISFFMQKFWTFKDTSTSRIKNQMTISFSIALMNLFLNVVFVYIFVEHFGIWYIFAQILSSIIISFESLILYIRFVFSKTCKVGENSILIASGIFPPDVGGPATHSLNFLEGFNRSGINSAVLTYSDVGKYSATDDKYNVVRVFRKVPFGFRHFFYLVKLFSLSVEYAVIYAQDARGAGFPSMIVSKILNKNFFLRMGGDLLWESVAEKGNTDLSVLNYYKQGLHRYKIIFYLSRLVIRSADKVIVPAQFLGFVALKLRRRRQ